MRAQHANQRLFRAVALAPQHAHDGLAAAKRASRRRSIHDRSLAPIGKILGVRLKKNPRQQAFGWSCIVRPRRLATPAPSAPTAEPVPDRRAKNPRSRCCHPAGPFCAKPAAACASGAGAICWISDRKPGKIRQQQEKIQFIPQRTVGGNLRANPPELSGFPRTGFSEMLPRASRNAVLRRQMDKRKSVRWRDGCGDPTAHWIIAWIGICR